LDREEERQREMETGCLGGQGSPRAVAPRGMEEERAPEIKPNFYFFEDFRSCALPEIVPDNN